MRCAEKSSKFFRNYIFIGVPSRNLHVLDSAVQGPVGHLARARGGTPEQLICVSVFAKGIAAPWAETPTGLGKRNG